MHIQTKSKGSKLNLQKYSVIPSTKPGEKFKKKWLGPRHAALVGPALNLARLHWDKANVDGIAMETRMAQTKKANEAEKKRRKKAADAREAKRLLKGKQSAWAAKGK